LDKVVLKRIVFFFGQTQTYENRLKSPSRQSSQQYTRARPKSCDSVLL